jgi:hypothetical protein
LWAARNATPLRPLVRSLQAKPTGKADQIVIVHPFGTLLIFEIDSAIVDLGVLGLRQRAGEPCFDRLRRVELGSLDKRPRIIGWLLRVGGLPKLPKWLSQSLETM